MQAIYQWQHPDWPHFRWNESEVSMRLARVRNLQGLLIGRVTTLGLDVQSSTMLAAMTDDVAASSSIEGIQLDYDSVRSSVARQLGIAVEGLPQPSHYIDGVVQVLVDAVAHAEEPLTEERMFAWHAALFPTGRSGTWPIDVGAWRSSAEPMQVVSGAMGKERVHYEAPPSDRVPQLMRQLLAWTNADWPLDPVLKAAIVHLWFVSIHPFEDGNGRIGRTLTDLFMARADRLPHRFYSLSAAILQDRKGYYDVLERTQHGNLDITEWLIWFLDMVERAVAKTTRQIERVLEKSRFWSLHREQPFNERERKILNRLLDGFEGKLTSSKYAKICHCSADTAVRDLRRLMSEHVLQQLGEGRGTHYLLADDNAQRPVEK